MRQAKVTLGGREYTLSTPPIRRSKEWRHKLARPFGDLAKAIELAGSVELSVADIPNIGDLVKRFAGTLIGSVDTMLDLLFDYSPALAADREWIEENAYDEEALEAFTEALKLAYPLDTILAMVSGRTVNRTSPNSPSANGASGQKALARKKTT